MTNNSQPSWHCVANLGDVNPFEHGGKFLMIDRRGIYPAELWVFSEWQEESPQMTLHTIVLKPCFLIRNETRGGYDVGANVYHTYSPEWFGDRSSTAEVSSFVGMDREEFCRLFCGNPYNRAIAYDAVASYYGLAEFDQSPRTFTTKREAKAFCNRMLSQIKKAEALPDGWR